MTGNGFSCPQQSCPGIHHWVMCWGGGAWYPSRMVGDWRDVSLPDVPSGVGAAGSKLGNEGWEAGKAPVGLRGSAELPPRRRRGANALLPRR